MTCIRLAPNIIACVNDSGRLHIGNRYVWVDMHPYCGPTFFKDVAMNDPYVPVDESDPVWPAFEAWHQKKQAEKEKAIARRSPPSEPQEDPASRLGHARGGKNR